MTDRNDIEALAKRVEALTGPDREVNWEVFCLHQPQRLRYYEDELATVKAETEANGLWDVRSDAIIAQTRGMYAPRYTASLDAAISLVPEGWRVRDFGDWEDRWTLSIMDEETCEEVYGRAGRGKPALALTAAALRARAAKGEG